MKDTVYVPVLLKTKLKVKKAELNYKHISDVIDYMYNKCYPEPECMK